jgi:hypothetical protein
MGYKPFKKYKVPEQKSDGTWLVSDLYAAAFLHAIGHQLLGVEDNGIYGTVARSSFLFADSGVIEVDYVRFTAGDEIGVRKFLDSVYELKSLLRDYPVPAGRK